MEWSAGSRVSPTGFTHSLGREPLGKSVTPLSLSFPIHRLGTVTTSTQGYYED